MATTTKTTGLLTKMKNAVAGMFSGKPPRKSPQHVAAGKQAATTAKVDKAVTATKKVVKKVAKKVSAPAKRGAARKRR